MRTTMSAKGTNSLCWICDTRPCAPQSDLCTDCEDIIWQIKSLLVEPYRDGTINKRSRAFLPELDFLFMRSTRLNAYFSFAWEIWLKFAALKWKKMKLSDVLTLKHTHHASEDIIETLESIQMISIENDQVSPGRLVQKGLDLRLGGCDLNDPKWVTAVRETRAIICLALTIKILERREYRPREILSLFEVFDRHVKECEKLPDVTKQIPAGRVTVGMGSHVGPRQQFKIFCDMIGIGVGAPRIIQDFSVTEEALVGWELKKESLGHLKNLRERFRERKQTRRRRGKSTPRS